MLWLWLSWSERCEHRETDKSVY